MRLNDERDTLLKPPRQIVFVLILASASVLSAFFWVRNGPAKHRVVIEEMGDRFTVSVYQLPEALRIPACYRPGDLEKELKVYPWLKPLLFTRFGIDEYIPREDWGEYAALEWNERRYAEQLKSCESLKMVVFEKEAAFWVGARIELTEVVLCETDKRRALGIYAGGVGADGKPLIGVLHKLVDLDGKWKRTADDDKGRLVKQVNNCRTRVMKLVAEGKLKTNAIRDLK